MTCPLCSHPNRPNAHYCASCRAPLLLQERYRITGLLGRGGYGAVYRAEHLELQIECAVKEILPEKKAKTLELREAEEQFRVEAVVDRVSTTGVAFLGLTLGCARCHDHKYDPISQREFYQLFAVFNNADEPALQVPSDQQAKEMPALAATLRDHGREFATQELLDPVAADATRREITAEFARIEPDLRALRRRQDEIARGLRDQLDRDQLDRARGD